MKVAVIGSGPAGMALAWRLREKIADVECVLFDLGRNEKARLCPVDLGLHCNGCKGVCNVISGIGGSMHYGDSIKLSGYPSGRRLHDHLGAAKYQKMENAALDFFAAKRSEFIRNKTEDYLGLNVRQYPVIEISESRLSGFLESEHHKIDITSQVKNRTRVSNVERDGSKFLVSYRSPNGDSKEHFDKVVLGTGRAGFSTTETILNGLGVDQTPPLISIGIRIELPAALLTAMYNVHPDFKFSEQFAGHKIKSFCFSSSKNLGGRLKFCHYQSEFSRPVVFLDGHSHVETPTDVDTLHETFGNFAILAQLSKEYDANWLKNQFIELYWKKFKGKPVFQPLCDYLQNESAQNTRSGLSVADASIGEVSELIPAEVNNSFKLAAMKIASAIAAGSGIETNDVIGLANVVAPEVEFFWPSVRLDSSFQTDVDGLYVIGDAAGIAQGNLQAAISGVAAADSIS